jgi:hypothetical protein
VRRAYEPVGSLGPDADQRTLTQLERMTQRSKFACRELETFCADPKA